MGRVEYSKTGMSGHRLNKIWRMMRQRCYNPNDQAYHNYGAKGVEVCDEWFRFDNFLEWALTNGYKDGLTLDRIYADKDYQPDNCRWVTKKENTSYAQKGNSHDRKSPVVEFRGRKQTVAEWARELGITTTALRYRLRSSHWTLEEALTTKSGERKRAKAN